MSAAQTGQELAMGAARPPFRHNRIGPLTDVNTLCLQWLIDEAKNAESTNAAFFRELDESLSTLSDAGLIHAAQVPLLLIDLHFQDNEWWIDHAPQRSGSTSSRAVSLPAPENTAAIGLARSTLVLAWHTARVDRDAALVMLGLSPTVADVFTQLHLQEIDSLSARHHQELQPRWARCTALWKTILTSASARDASQAHALALQCLSLVAGDILIAS
jgi:hypothetical protein